MKIAVIQGPGGFTGLRIGIVIANTLAYSLNAKIIPITTIQYLEQKIPTKYKEQTAIILRAGGENALIKLPNEKEQITTLKNFKFNNEIQYFIGELSPTQTLPLKQLTDLLTFKEVIQNYKGKEEQTTKPIYIKPPTITKSKKQIFT